MDVLPCAFVIELDLNVRFRVFDFRQHAILRHDFIGATVVFVFDN